MHPQDMLDVERHGYLGNQCAEGGSGASVEAPVAQDGEQASGWGFSDGPPTDLGLGSQKKLRAEEWVLSSGWS